MATPASSDASHLDESSAPQSHSSSKWSGDLPPVENSPPHTAGAVAALSDAPSVRSSIAVPVSQRPDPEIGAAAVGHWRLDRPAVTTDVDEFDTGAVSDSNAAANSVAENAANGAVVGITAFASDADGTTNAISYSLVDAGGNPVVGSPFAINAATGVVTVADGSQLNYEAATNQTLYVKATSADGSASTQSFTVNLTDVDEFDTGAVGDSNAAANSVAENAANGAVVGITAFASDADGSNNAISYSLVDAGGAPVAGGPFAINAATGVVIVADGSQLNYEAASS
jgi:hypothetical protein